MSAASLQQPPGRTSTGSALALAALAILLANVGLVFVDVLMRWVLRAPQSWVSDIGQVSYPVAIACCFPAALESGHMIAIRFLGDWLGPRRARGLDILGQLALAALLVGFTWKMVQRAQSEWSGGFTTANIALPVGPTWSVVAALLAVSALVQLRLLWRSLAAPPAAGHG